MFFLIKSKKQLTCRGYFVENPVWLFVFISRNIISENFSTISIILKICLNMKIYKTNPSPIVDNDMKQ